MNKLERRLKEKLGDVRPIEGFRVMEWLRGVRNASYELFTNDPEAYQKEMEEASDRMYAMIGEERKGQKTKVIA